MHPKSLSLVGSGSGDVDGASRRRVMARVKARAVELLVWFVIVDGVECLSLLEMVNI